MFKIICNNNDQTAHYSSHKLYSFTVTCTQACIYWLTPIIHGPQSRLSHFWWLLTYHYCTFLLVLVSIIIQIRNLL